jgi:hypothetical protein
MKYNRKITKSMLRYGHSSIDKPTDRKKPSSCNFIINVPRYQNKIKLLKAGREK